MSFLEAARRLAGQAGLLLGWRPHEFWAATPDELADALGALRVLSQPRDAPMDRAILENMMEEHPDG